MPARVIFESGNRKIIENALKIQLTNLPQRYNAVGNRYDIDQLMEDNHYIEYSTFYFVVYDPDSGQLSDILHADSFQWPFD